MLIVRYLGGWRQKELELLQQVIDLSKYLCFLIFTYFVVIGLIGFNPKFERIVLGSKSLNIFSGISSSN
jgi:hypothetical protein